MCGEDRAHLVISQSVLRHHLIGHRVGPERLRVKRRRENHVRAVRGPNVDALSEHVGSGPDEARQVAADPIDQVGIPVAPSAEVLPRRREHVGLLATVLNVEVDNDTSEGCPADVGVRVAGEQPPDHVGVG